MVERAADIYRILLDSGIEENEIKKQMKQKSIEFQGFMSKEAILYLIAKENGINIVSSGENDRLDNQEEMIDYDDFLIPISQINEGMYNIVIKGWISSIFGVKEFVRKDGSLGKVGTFQISDKNDYLKIVLWGDLTKIMENELFKEGLFIRIIGGYSKKGIDKSLEVHLSRQGKIIFHEVKKNGRENRLSKNNDRKPLKYTIQNLYDKNGFIRSVYGFVHIEDFKEITLKNGDKTFLLKLIISDRTGSIKVNIWDMKAVEYLKILNEGKKVKLTNVLIKFNSYSNEKEISFTKSSRLKTI
jgi:replication factor A1